MLWYCVGVTLTVTCLITMFMLRLSHIISFPFFHRLLSNFTIFPPLSFNEKKEKTVAKQTKMSLRIYKYKNHDIWRSLWPWQWIIFLLFLVIYVSLERNKSGKIRKNSISNKLVCYMWFIIAARGRSKEIRKNSWKMFGSEIAIHVNVPGTLSLMKGAKILHQRSLCQMQMQKILPANIEFKQLIYS